MPWLRYGDNAATHPAVMALATDREAEPWTMNEVLGFITRCATQSAGHMTDYYVDLGTALTFGNGRHEVLLRQAARAGLVTPVGRGRARRWKLIDDPEFLHLRLREEVEWERQRKRDNSNDELTVPVRRRDGDGCRYCLAVVNWADRKGGRGGTYEHLEPGKPATTETLVVACRSCNSSLKEKRRTDPAAAFQLQPVPARPYYSRSTVKFLEAHGIDVPADNPRPEPLATPQPAGHREPSRPRTQRDTVNPTVATSQPAGHRETTATPSAAPQPAEERASSRPGPQPDTVNQQDPRDSATSGAARTSNTSSEDATTEPGRPGPEALGGPPDRVAPHDHDPPPWADPGGSADYLQVSADSGRKEGYGPGRGGVGSGTGAGAGASSSPLPSNRSSPSPPANSPSANPTRRRARRRKR